MRELDWSKTPLGPVEGWTQSLRTSVSTCLDCAFGIILWWGPKLAVLYNDEYRAFLSPEKHPALLGQPGSVMWAEIWDTIEPMLRQVMERGEATRSRDLMLHIVRAGYPEEAYFSFSYSPIRDDDGSIGGVFCPVIETTDKVIGERRLRTLRDLAAECKGAESEHEVFASAARILAANPCDIPFALIYRVDKEEDAAQLEKAIGIEAGRAASPRRVALSDDPWSLREVARSGQPQVTDLRQFGEELPTGAWKVAPQTAMVLPVSRPGAAEPHAILVAAVSPMRALDEPYRTFFGLVATQIASGLADAEALEEQRRRAAALAEIDRAKTVFFSNVSHEFRTPLTLMLAPLDDLLARGDLPAESVAELAVVRRNGRRLLKLVNTLLDFSRIEAGRLQASYEPIDLPAFTAELASTFRSAIEKVGLQLVVDCPALPSEDPVFVDRQMWETIVLNLISNAFKFTYEGTIAVGLHASPDGRGVELTVSDTGTGIPVEARPRVFERFYRVDNARGRTHEGSGIGLALVHELIRLHGGTVRVESELGRGSTFTVWLPRGCAHLPGDRVQAAAPPSTTVPLRAQIFVEEAERWIRAEHMPTTRDSSDDGAWNLGAVDDLAGVTIVVADDNADMVEYLERLLARRFRVITASDGEAALGAIRRERPELVITDIMMPRLDGFGLLHALRTDPATQSLPVIALSARAGEEAKLEGLQAGADVYMLKPFTARELMTRVEVAIRLHRMRQETETALRNRTEQFRTLINQAPLGVYLVDADFRIRDVNPIALPAFGDIPGGVEGRDFDEIMHILWEKDYADLVVGILRQVLETGNPYVTAEQARYRIDRNVTEYYEWRLDRITLPDGRYGVVCYFRDISAHVHARHELAASVDRLTRAERALREASRHKDEFLAILAHEMRNPLAPILNSLQILRSPSTSDPLRQQVQAMMERQVSQLKRLVEDLLDVARITRGDIALHKESSSLTAILEHAIDTSRPLIDAAGHLLTVALPEEPVIIDADPVRLSQVFTNLLNNAAKYTDRAGRIDVVVTPQPRTVEISITDSGRGIAPDTMPRLFELFARGGESTERAMGGLGVGLGVVRKLIELHGGEVHAKSAGRGRGSTFVVRMPRSERRTSPRPARDETRPGSSPLSLQRVLVVDDNRDAADSLGLLLQLQGVDAHIVYDGNKALAALHEYRPTLVFLDIGMPGMDGYEVARRMRARPEGRDVVLIALTGWGQEADRRRARSAGFDHHLTKPIDIDALPRLLQELVLQKAQQA
ncbi:MAG TPA: ATP-binding protein [Gemmatimonadales bacterium]|nr:ATP-binding protein [Gemmatimonadales bacterium]